MVDLRFSLLLGFFLFALLSSAQSDNNIFSEFRGMEDNRGNTHLYFKEYHGGPGWYSNDVYHMDLCQGNVTLFLQEYYFTDPSGFNDDGVVVEDYEFWHKDPASYIYCGAWMKIDPTAYISRWDSIGVFTWMGMVNNIEISSQNDSLVYAEMNQNLFKSLDGGITWDFDPGVAVNYFKLISISPFNDRIIFSSNPISGTPRTAILHKSNDGGVTFSAVDTVIGNYSKNRLYFDPDSQHIYTVVEGIYGNSLNISPDGGNSWHELLTDSVNLSVAIDEKLAGTLFLSRGSEIYTSNDYGMSWTFYHQLDSAVIGLYKKPGIELLYVATRKAIIEISPSGVTVLRNLPSGINAGSSTLAGDFELLPNYPNPFNQITLIEFFLPKSEKISLEIFDINGRHLKTVENGILRAGIHRRIWDGKDSAGKEVSSGIYFCRLIHEGHFQIRKLVLLR
ncbi:MAG: T9SS C-terminal target domain-containing protein [Calditrichaeota bacterium]|nr:T9SS type A sorting domain-containing protein [Calditrichota bacterium]RQW03946.1 MAG: T9SS C-terminal target domain-containing protein [Calditrichota bacterium]